MKYKNYNVNLEYSRYTSNDSVAIILNDVETHDVITVCTVNLNELLPNEIGIKDYSENEGMLDWLLENDIVTEPHRYIQSGWVLIPICYLKKEVK